MSEHSRLVSLADAGRKAVCSRSRPPSTTASTAFEIFQAYLAGCRPLESHAFVSAAVLLISRVGAANQSSECLRSIYFPLGMPSFVGRGLTSVYCKQTSEV
jgi:hypothetical protein